MSESPERVIKKLHIEKRGRKYFSCPGRNHKASLLINGVSDGLEVGGSVFLEVEDLSVRSDWGVRVLYNPVRVLSEHEVARLLAEQEAKKAERDRQRQLAWQTEKDEKLLAWAEDHAREGLSRTGSILAALDRCEAYDHLSDRLQALKKRVDANVAATDEAKAKRQKAREERLKNRIVHPCSDLPPLDKPVRLNGVVVVYEYFGRSFPIGESLPACSMFHLWDHVGKPGCYCYYREATDSEARDVMEAKEPGKQDGAQVFQFRPDGL